MTPQQDKQEAAQIDMDAANARLEKVLHGAAERNPDIGAALDARIDKPPKKRRSDAGKPRVKPEPAPAGGKLTAHEWERIGMLHEECVQAMTNLQHAQGRAAKANSEYAHYLDSLKSA